MEKKPGSVFVFRNERAEAREAARFNSTRQKTMELLLSKIQAQIEKEEEGMTLSKIGTTYFCVCLSWHETGVLDARLGIMTAFL